MANLKLYHHPLSGHSHRARLLLSLLDLPVELKLVDLMKGEHKTDEFLRLNPNGQVPVLTDGDTVIHDSNAILTYLAKRYDPSRRWLPDNPELAARIQRVLTDAAGALVFGPANARLITLFGAGYDAEQTIHAAHTFLARLDRDLRDRSWLVTDHATIADVALYSYVAHAPEGNVSLAEYPAVRNWLTRVESLPGFVPMQRSAVGLAA